MFFKLLAAVCRKLKFYGHVDDVTSKRFKKTFNFSSEASSALKRFQKADKS